jgi:hypothetical protein
MKPTESLKLESNMKLLVMNIHDIIRKQAQCIPTWKNHPMEHIPTLNPTHFQNSPWP